HDYWTKFGIFGVPPDGEVPDYLHPADSLSELATKLGVDELRLLRTVDRSNPEARRARDPESGGGDAPSDRSFGAFYPRCGRFSPDARLPGRPAAARARGGAPIGPVVCKDAGRAARKRAPARRRSRVVGPLARVVRPLLKGPKSSVLGPIDTPPYYALEV